MRSQEQNRRCGLRLTWAAVTCAFAVASCGGESTRNQHGNGRDVDGASGDRGVGGGSSVGGASSGSGGNPSTGATTTAVPGSTGGGIGAGGTGVGSSGDGTVPTAPEGTGIPSVVGDLDGEEIDITPDDAVGHGGGGSSDVNGWNMSVAIGDAATLYLWSDGESTRGLLEIAPADPATTEWVCLEDVQISPDAASWSSSKLSRLGSCDLNDGLPLDLSFPDAGTVQGSFREEPVDWRSSGAGTRAGFAYFEFNLGTGERATLSLDLRDEQDIFTAGEADVDFARLVVVRGEGAAACGGSGVVDRQGDMFGNGAFSIRIDEFNALRTCPGEAVEGELGGGL